MTFRLRAPNAREVTVTGLGTPLAMTRDEQGVWAVSAGPLMPDIYEYRFSIDGASVLDPSNTSVSGNNSILHVPGAPWSSTGSHIPRGALTRHEYVSTLMGGALEYVVYTPPGYDHKRRQPYPVFVVLHGLGGQADHWPGRGGANLTLDALIAEGKAVPMILVSPRSQGAGNAAAGFANFTKALLTEILPQVQRHYNASSARTDRAISGLSMGGAQSLLMLNHLDEFAWIGSFSPGFDMYDPGWGMGRGGAAAPGARGAGPANPMVGGVRQRPVLADGILSKMFPNVDAKANSRLKLLYVMCGTADDHLDLTRQFRDFLASKQVKLTYLEVPDAGHVWPLWREQFATMSQMLFRN